MNQTAFITGHLDLTPEEFELHYVPQIDKYLALGFNFVVGDARGCDTLAQMYLFKQKADVVVYHMFDSPRNNPHGFGLQGGYLSDSTRDEAMHQVSSVTLGWVRPGRETSGTAKNLNRPR